MHDALNALKVRHNTLFDLRDELDAHLQEGLALEERLSDSLETMIIEVSEEFETYNIKENE